MNKNLNNTIQELGKSIQVAQQDALMQINGTGINPRNTFQATLNHNLQQFAHNMPTYLLSDNAIGYAIIPK